MDIEVVHRALHVGTEIVEAAKVGARGINPGRLGEVAGRMPVQDRIDVFSEPDLPCQQHLHIDPRQCQQDAGQPDQLHPPVPACRIGNVGAVAREGETSDDRYALEPRDLGINVTSPDPFAGNPERYGGQPDEGNCRREEDHGQGQQGDRRQAVLADLGTPSFVGRV